MFYDTLSYLKSPARVNEYIWIHGVPSSCSMYSNLNVLLIWTFLLLNWLAQCALIEQIRFFFYFGQVIHCLRENFQGRTRDFNVVIFKKILHSNKSYFCSFICYYASTAALLIERFWMIIIEQIHIYNYFILVM